MIRNVTLNDIPALLAIYNTYIQTPITFEYELPSQEEFRSRVRNIARAYPYLVMCEQGQVIGFSYADRLAERVAYQWSAQLSIYLAPEWTHKGLGTQLYTAVMERLVRMGIRGAYACVALPNEASEGMHRALGFELVGKFYGAGYKNGEWHDVGWFQRWIGEGNAPQVPFFGLGGGTSAS